VTVKDTESTDRLIVTLSVSELRAIVREEMRASGNGEFLTPKELAERLHMPLSWVYERSRQGRIPTHRFGKYLRFNLAEVLDAEKEAKENGDSPLTKD